MSVLNRLYTEYKDRVEFFVVYIREAHPSDGWRPDRGTSVKDPTTLLERAGVAQTCSLKLDLKLPMLIDSLDDKTNASYAAWPDRLFLVDAEGKIAYRGGQGPRGFKPEELERAIEGLLGKKDSGD